MVKKSIIIIDDELLIRDLLYDFFSEKDWLVSVTESGEKSAEIMKNRSFDVALVDLRMPDIDGLSVVRKIRSLYQDLPIVIITGFPTVESAIEALRLKVDDFYVKPFNINKLYKTAEVLAEQHQKRRSAIHIEDVPL